MILKGLALSKWLTVFRIIVNNTDSQKQVEVSARERIQKFMLALGNLIITPQKNQKSMV